jgi:hypothetical protein
MSDTKKIPTYTITTVLALSMEIYTWYYSISDLDLLNCFIAEEVGYVNYVDFIEGHGLATANHIPENVFAEVNRMGGLDIIVQSKEASNSDPGNYRLDHSTGILYYDIP